MDGQTQFPTQDAPDVDLSEFAPYLDGLDLTEDQQTELLQTLWAIMCAFADFGFGIEPTQLICGWIEETRAQGAIPASNAVNCKDKPTTRNFNAAAVSKAAGKETS
ncbi:hypothetical protein AWH62_12825 [Maricaulis sp. W15]|uniref:hypothetical protein n=1 Tax=Maricaulis sp. W15 TaxID=1772333 RepID=UPI000948FCFF|nr:hypothetical protein [Maricaulis sp. W15]OLF71424.1 hypothetical protein AWH62_12825 [Maricaulis sp. W15]